MISFYLLKCILVDMYKERLSSYGHYSRKKHRESDYKRPCLLVYKKTRWEAHLRPIECVQAVSGRKTKGRSVTHCRQDS